MKILIITDAWHPQVNGVVRTYEHLKSRLEELGHSVLVLGPRDFGARVSAPGYKEVELAGCTQKSLKQRITSFAPDTIHIATEGPLGWAARKYCLKNKLPFSTSYHSQFPTYLAMRLSKWAPFLFKFYHRIGVEVIKHFHNRSNALLVTTQSMTDELKGWGVTTPIYKFTKGIDRNVFNLGEKTLFQDLKKPIALYVGRLAMEKNVEEFLDMDWHGSKVVVGHGPDAHRYKKKYKDIHFMGKKTGAELADHYRSADLFVFPSYTDTFGIVLIEALSCGIPIAAHDAIGPKDVVIDPKLGALDNDLGRAAQNALKNGCAQDRHNYVQQHYTWALATQQFLEVAEKLQILK